MTRTLNDLADLLYSDRRAEIDENPDSGHTSTVYGTAMSDSANGLVVVKLSDDATQAGGYEGIDETGVELPTVVNVHDGDEVIVTLVGGKLKTPFVSGVVGIGDETNSRITAIETDYVKATMLEADLAEIGVLTADSAVISEIQAETAKVENVTAAQLEASTAYIGALQTGNVTAQNIIADKAKLAQIDTSQITADHAVINTLDSNYAKIDLANVSNAWIDDGVIRDAAIGDAQIADISANKLTAGTINGSVINVTNLNATNITTGTINGQRLGEGSISLSKLSESVYTEGEVDSIVSNLNDRIDSAIETYTATAVPTLSNYPASSWDTDDEKAEHVGDICYVLNAGSETDGYTYRFAYDNSTGTYQWVLIKDNQVTAALQRLVDAEGDIDGLQSFQSDTSVWISDTDEALNVIRNNHTSLTTVVNKTIVETVQLWYSKANTTAPAKPTSQVTSTSTSGGAWRTVVPSYSTSYPNYFYCYQWKYADGTYGWSSVTRDIAMGEAQSTSRTAASDAASAATTANSNIKSNVQLWYTKQTSTAPSKPNAHVTTNNAGTANAWNLAVPTYNATYPHYFYCYEYQLGNGTYGWTNVVYDSAMTESQERARTAVSNAATAQTAAEGAATAASNAQNTANKNVKTSIQLWYTKANEEAPAKPSAKVTSDSTSGGGWRTVVPSYNASYPKYFYCYQYELADGTYTWSDVVFDRATTENEANAHSALTQLTTKVDTQTFNDLTDTVSEHTRNITTLTTTTQQMTQKIDNISVGGRNLIWDSTWKSTNERWSDWGAAGTTTREIVEIDGKRWLHVASSAQYQGWQQAPNKRNGSGELVAGEEVTLSFVARAASPTSVSVVGFHWLKYDGKIVSQSWNAWTIPVEATRFKRTYTVPSEATGFNVMVGSNIAADVELWVADLKLEKGNVATDWTPAPEDMATGAQLTTVSNTVNTVSQTADSNLQKISNLTTTLGTNADGTTNVNDIVHRESALEQDLSGFKSTVSETYATKDALSAETTARTTAIQQTTEAIALKANSSDVYTKTATDGLISTEVTNRNAAIQTATDGIRSEVSETYATKTEVRRTDAGSGTVVTSDDAANLPPLSITIHGKSVQDGAPSPSSPVEIKSVEAPNLAPFFSVPFDDFYNADTNPDGYWNGLSGGITDCTTQLADGWAHVEFDNTSGTGTRWMNFNAVPDLTLKTNTSYMFITEVRNLVTTPTSSNNGATIVACSSNSDAIKGQFNGSANSGILTKDVVSLSMATSRSSFDGCATRFRSYLQFTAGCKASFDFRLSVYETSNHAAYSPFGSISVNTSGRNIFGGPYINSSINTTTGAITASNTTNYTSRMMHVTNSAATILVEDKGEYGGSINFACYDSDGAFLGFCQPLYFGSSMTVPYRHKMDLLTNTASIIATGYYASGAALLNTAKVAIYDGDVDYPYEPYSPVDISIPLQGNSVCATPSFGDLLEVDSEGNATLTKNMGSYTITGDETVTNGTVLGNYRRGVLRVLDGEKASKTDLEQGGAGAKSGLCTNAEYLVGYSVNSVHVYTHVNSIYLFAVAASDADLLSAYTGATIYYPLATPQTISLGKIDLPSLPSPSFYAHVDASVTPTLDAEWWTQGGEEVGSVYQRASALEQNAEGLSVRMMGLETDAVRKSKDEWTAWLDVGTDSGNNPFLAMGQSGNDLNSRLSNESMGFYNGTEELMKLSGAEGVKADTVRTKRVYIGSWILEELDSGDMAIKLVGGGA